MRDDVCGKCGRGVIPGYLWAYEDLFVCGRCFPPRAETLKAPESVEESLLFRAQKLICGDRQRDYGDKLQNFAQTAMIWTGIVAHKLLPGQTITPEDVCLLMMGLKMSRLAKSPGHKDSVLDIAGYTGCYDMLQGERERGVKLSGSTHDSGPTQDSGKTK